MIAEGRIERLLQIMPGWETTFTSCSSPVFHPISCVISNPETIRPSKYPIRTHENLIGIDPSLECHHPKNCNVMKRKSRLLAPPAASLPGSSPGKNTWNMSGKDSSNCIPAIAESFFISGPYPNLK
jgi:hypothetical protein